jgi:putative transposase
MRVLAYCLMPNHFHLVLWPHGDDELSRWMLLLTSAYVARHRRRHDTGGHLWEDRFARRGARVHPSPLTLPRN